MIFSRRSSGAVFLGTLLIVLFLLSRHLVHQELANSFAPGVLRPNDPPNKDYYDDMPEPPFRRPHVEACAWIPDTSNILLVMKTGASESFNKIPTQLMTTLRCLDDYLIFSDMEQRIAGAYIHDSLESVLKEAKEGNEDFDLYRRQQECPVDQENCIQEARKEGSISSNAGWNLDKYKNVHMAEKAYRMRPDYDWYVFVDADTYILWPNMVQWLGQLSPSQKHYLGSVAFLGGFPFAHGGSGYVLSRATMESFAGKHPGIANKYDKKVKETCCGDHQFSVALKETSDVSVHHVWPTINGEKPYTLPYNKNHWCHPIVSMHHLNSEEVSSFWDFERGFYNSSRIPVHEPVRRTLLIKDIYQALVASKLQAKREDWDNLSEEFYYLDPNAKQYEDWQLKRHKKDSLTDLEKIAHKSFEHCRNMCEKDSECFQFRFQDGICASQRSFVLGKPKRHAKGENQRSMSGWDVKKIRRWTEAQGECKTPLWPSVPSA